MENDRGRIGRNPLKGVIGLEWDLSIVYKSKEEALRDSEEAVKLSRELLDVDVRKLDKSSLKRFFEKVEDVLWKSLLPLQYASLLFSKNMQDEEAQKLYGILQRNYSFVDENISAVKARLSSLPLEKLESLKDVENYSHVVEKIIEDKEHTLSEEAEKVLSALSVSRRDAAADTYEKLTASYTFEVDGKRLTGEEVRALRYQKNGNLRKRAMRIFLERYRKDGLVIESLYNIVVKDWDTEARLRKYDSPISMRNSENEVSDEVVQELIDVTTENYHIVERYYEWKSQFVGEELTPADVYAPIGNVGKEYSFEDAKKIVLEAYYEFSDTAGRIVESFFNEKRIDAFPAPGKRGGAFCSYNVPNGKPFVLLNFTGKIRDVMTMAHELGHGLHGTLSSKQTLLNYHTPLTMAEVASVFGEFLVFDKLKRELSGDERKAFIASKIEDIFATMFRQNMFVKFEIRAHDLVSKEGFASFNDLSKIYAEELSKMFGKSVRITEEYHDEWSSIPHFFFAPFYVYAYNFANALVIALYRRYVEEGEKFVPKYLSLLESGGKDKPERLLKTFGMDIKDRSFWESAFEFLESLVEEVIS